MKKILTGLGIVTFGVLGCFLNVIFYAITLAVTVWVGFKVLNWLF